MEPEYTEAALSDWGITPDEMEKLKAAEVI
jgi:hypothetical protein